MTKHHTVEGLHFVGDVMVMTVNGEEKRFQLREVSEALAEASEAERQHFEISPSGYGVHWPLIDEDLSIDGLLGIVSSGQPFQKVA